jgi:hypothetical protein
MFQGRLARYRQFDLAKNSRQFIESVIVIGPCTGANQAFAGRCEGVGHFGENPSFDVHPHFLPKLECLENLR